jgi:hypothetical protein
MFDQTSIALAGTAVRRMHEVSRYEDRVARPRRLRLPRLGTSAPVAPTVSIEPLVATC